MKRIITLLTASALAISLSACGSTGNNTTTDSTTTATSATSTNALDENEESRVSVNGSQVTLTVRANHTTGYSWVVDDSGSDMFEVEADKYVEDEHEEGTTGVGGTETFTINILQSGTGGLIFEYKQDWDGGQSDGKYNLNVTATEENGKPVVTDAEFVKLKDDNDSSTAQNTDYIPSVQVDGIVYKDTGYVSSALGCGNMDGEITSSVDGSEMPSEDNQSNFGTGYEYQLGYEGIVLVQMNGQMEIFRDASSKDTSIPDLVASFIGQVEKIDGDTILLKYVDMPEDALCLAPEGGNPCEYTTSSSAVSGDVKPGDYVMVWYTGSIAETDPAQIEAYQIEKTDYTPAESSTAS